MKETLFKIFNPIPLKNRRNRIIVNQLVSTVIALLIVMFPYMRYCKVYNNEAYSAYTNDGYTVDQRIYDSIHYRLQKNNMKFTSNIDIFLPATQKEYNMCTYYIVKQSLGVNYLLLNRIIINPNIPETRNTVDIIMHEMAHSYLKQKYGFFKSYNMPKWKQEGFCEYIAQSSSMPKEEALKILNDSNLESKVQKYDDITTKRYQYYTYRAAFEYLIRIKKMSVDEIIEQEINFDEVLNSVRKHNSTTTK